MRVLPIVPIALAFMIPAPMLAAGAENPSANFTVSQQTLVPGMTLQPGSYSIKVLDHLQDRYIVRIDNASGNEHSTFISVQDPKVKSLGKTGAVPWTAGPDGNSALRGFTFGSSTPPLEFVYPKSDAVAIAKLNDSKVPAIDPASEGRPAEVSGLSKEDMEIVTLWLLSSSTVSPTDTAPTIKAEKMQQVASNKPPKPVLDRLPHTASLLPSTLLTGFIAAGSAVLLRRRRIAEQRVL